MSKNSKKILFKNVLALLVLGSLGSFVLLLVVGLIIFVPPFRYASICIASVGTLIWSIQRLIGMQTEWHFMEGHKTLKRVLTEAD